MRHENIYDVVRSSEFDKIPITHIRNFSIIAHVDHGKSTLSDSLLVLAGNISEKDKRKGQVLDSLKVERERGITVKAQTATMMYVCIYVCMHVYMYICMYICIYVCMYVCMYAWVNVIVYMYEYVNERFTVENVPNLK